jgi:hypothetical protein
MSPVTNEASSLAKKATSLSDLLGAGHAADRVKFGRDSAFLTGPGSRLALHTCAGAKM